MNGKSGRGPAIGAMWNESGGGPWGGRGGSGGGSGGGDGGGDGLGPRNPWSQPPRKRPAGRPGGIGPSALDELLRRGKARFGGGLPQPQGKPIWIWGILLLACVWILSTSVHQIDSQERGVLIRMGRYASTLRPGISISLPAPLWDCREDCVVIATFPWLVTSDWAAHATLK